MLNTDKILKQESESSLPHFGLEDLNDFVETLIETGKSNYERVCILIKLNKRPVFFHAGNKTTNENNVWISKKEHTVDLFDHSSLFEKALNADNPEQFFNDSGLSPQEYAIVGGGLPIIVDQVGIVGSLIVSGLTDEEDHELGYNSLLAYKEKIK